ncbi:A24 family peptidase [Aquibacillus albus]|uniref:Prepilin peptidase CpaA n=1 Tax=Aquibacillus albus TaxID=1168171 RepID=A0ABS2N3C0_9BACI|nr:prepilin peptidase [Aquibacillus albus]MBM7572612.1 prepilin peptidase CpaA [Aquibacillus albus]
MLINILLFIILLTCVITDLKSRKIYNHVIFPSLVLALLFHFFTGGFSGLGHSLLGLLTGFAILLIPYLMGGMGAGDVKLLAVIGAIKGVSFVLAAAVYMAIIGAAIGLAIMLFRRGAFQRMRVLVYSLCGMKYGVKIFPSQESLQATYPYGVAIAGGTMMAFFVNGVQFL